MSRAIKAAIAVGVVVVVAVAVVLITSGGEATADEVRFENVADPGPNPFTTPTDVPKSSSESTAASGEGAASDSGAASGSPSPSAATPSPESAVPGLAGATGSKSGASAASGEPTVCDREKLVAELVADPDKLGPWADAVGVDSDAKSVAAFIRKLRPVTITRDTQVTDHFYDDGSAKDFQAILPKGTAALVEEDGTPVARCRSGSPLSKPVKLETKTKCVNCPANFQRPANLQRPATVQPPLPCDEECFRPEPTAPPVEPPTAPVIPPTDPIATAKTELARCHLDKRGLKGCEVEYESARKECAANPLNPLCDSSICFDVFVGSPHVKDVFSDGCGSYISDADLTNWCFKNREKATDRLACQENFAYLQKACAANPSSSPPASDKVPSSPIPCQIAPQNKAVILRRQCTENGERPECKVVQVACAKNAETGCDTLQNTCLTKPDRPDCKAVSDLKQACAKDPKQPDCQGLTPQGAQGLQQQEQPVVPGDELVPPDQGAPPDPGADPGAGEAPPAGEGQQPQEAPPPEGPPPEGPTQ